MAPQCGAADAEIKVPSGENTELKRSPIKAWVGQYIAIHASLTARDFSSLLISTLPVHSPTFFSNLSRFFLCWLWLTHGSCVGPQNKKKVTLPEAGSRVECPRNINRPQNMTCGMMTCEMNDVEIE